MNFSPKIKEIAMLRPFTAGLLVMACLFGGSAWAAPRLTVEQPIYDFGEVLQGQTVRHTFNFSNAGDAPLQIDKVASSCGCTAVLLSAKTLAPGQRGDVQADFDSTRFRGEVTKTVTLYSNDPTQPAVQLHVKGKVQEALSAIPGQVNLGTVAAGKPVVAQVSLTNHTQGDLRLENPQTSSPDLTVALKADKLAAGQSTVIDIQLTPISGSVNFSGYVMLQASGSVRSDLRIPVHASILRPAN
jgi:hypothetical protein